MKPNHLHVLAALCATVHADLAPDAVIVTDPQKIVRSTTYNLGERLLTVQELTKEAMPMPPPPAPQAEPITKPLRPNLSP